LLHSFWSSVPWPLRPPVPT